MYWNWYFICSFHLQRQTEGRVPVLHHEISEFNGITNLGNLYIELLYVHVIQTLLLS